MSPSVQYAPSGFKVWAPPPLQKTSESHRQRRSSTQVPSNGASRQQQQYPYAPDPNMVPPRSGAGVPSRPPSTNAYYRPQTSSGADKDAFAPNQPQYASSSTYHFPSTSTGTGNPGTNSRPPLAQGRSSTAPTPLQHLPSLQTQPPSSKATHESSGSRSMLSKMFSRVKANSHSHSTAKPQVVSSEEKNKSSHKHHRTQSAQAVPTPYTSSKTPSSSNPPPSAPPTATTWTALDQAIRANTASAMQRQDSREERANAKLQKTRDRDERHRERDERARADRAREDKARAEYVARRLEAEQGPATTKATKLERPPSRRDKNDPRPEYDSDNMQKRVGASSSLKLRPDDPQQSRYPSNSSSMQPTSAQPPQSIIPSRGNTPSTVQPSFRQPGVPILPSTSSHSTSVSSKTFGVVTQSKAVVSGAQQQYSVTASADERNKAREAEREAYTREREKERARDKDRDRQREAEREARHREREREKERDREREREREKEKEREHRSDKHRSHRDRSYSQPAVVNPALMSGSDTERERSGRKESRHHRSSSQAQVHGGSLPYGQTASLAQDGRRPESRRESAPFAPPTTTATASKQPDTVVYPRSDIPATTHTTQQSASRQLPERRATEPVIPPLYGGHSGPGTSHTTVTMQNTPWAAPSNSHPQVISIHAAQGPPDPDVPYKRTNDSSSSRMQSAQQGYTNPLQAPAISQSLPTYSSNPSSRSYAPGTGHTNSLSQGNARNEMYSANPLEKNIPPGSGPSSQSPSMFGVSPMMQAPSNSSSMQQHADGRRNSMAPSLAPSQMLQYGLNTNNGSPKGISTSQPNNSPGHFYKRSSFQAQNSPHATPIVVTRTPSAASQKNVNSDSPGNRPSLQVPSSSQTPFASGPVSRTPSNNSQHTATGAAYHTPSSTPLMQQSNALPAVGTSAAHSSPYDSLNTTRPAHAFTTPNMTSVSSQLPSTAYSSSSAVQNALPRPDNKFSSFTSDQHYNSLSHQNSISHNVHSQAQNTTPSSYYNAPQKSSTAAFVAESLSSALPSHTPDLNQSMYNTPTSRAPDFPSQSQSVSRHALPQSFGQAMTPRPSDYERALQSSDGAIGSTLGHPSMFNDHTSSPSPPHSLVSLANSAVPMARSSSSAYYATSTRQPVPLGSVLPGEPTGPFASTPVPIARTPSQSTPPTGPQSATQLMPLAPSKEDNLAASTRVPVTGYSTSTQLPDTDSPPPLTPSSSHDSHEDILLMTPSSLDPSKGNVQPQHMSISIQRPEEAPKRKGLFGLFRSKSKDSREPVESEMLRPQTAGPSQRLGGGGNKLRSARHPPGSAAAALHNKAEFGADSTKFEKPIPPPISIPPPSAFAFGEISPSKFHNVRVKAKRYRTVSSASVEALDGTANNTVVGSPTSSMRSHTPGPLTPPLRDAVEAAHEWRNVERHFIDRGRARRRRPGVTFDVLDEDAPKSYRLARASRLYGNGDSSE